jgi:cytochrome P450
LAPQMMALYESDSRRIVTELIDEFIEDGHSDLIEQLARKLPGQMLYRVLFGIDDREEVEQILAWLHALLFDSDSPDRVESMQSWSRSIVDFVASRRVRSRRPDIVDALLHGSVEGRPLTDEEIVGAIKILVLGGFVTTTDAIGSTLVRLLENMELQESVRSDPTVIPNIIDEVLRLDPPVSHIPRMCTRDVEINGQRIGAGEHLLLLFNAANRDPSEFEFASEMDVERRRNRHLAFGGGPHRCIGSNLARFVPHHVFDSTGGTWGVESLRVVFDPGQRILR